MSNSPRAHKHPVFSQRETPLQQVSGRQLAEGQPKSRTPLRSDSRTGTRDLRSEKQNCLSSNESLPVRSANESQNQNSNTYDFLYDPDVITTNGKSSGDRSRSQNRSKNTNESHPATTQRSAPRVSEYSELERQQLYRPSDETEERINTTVEYDDEEYEEEYFDEEVEAIEEEESQTEVSELSPEQQQRQKQGRRALGSARMGSLMSHQRNLTSLQEHSSEQYETSEKKAFSGENRSADSNRKQLMSANTANFLPVSSLESTIQHVTIESRKKTDTLDSNNTLSPLKRDSSNHIFQQWTILAEKSGLRLVMKELWTQASAINEIFYRQQQHQELILSDKNIRANNRAIVDFPFVAQHQLLLSGTSKRQSTEGLRQKSNSQLLSDVRSLVERVGYSFGDFLKSQREVVNVLAKERERNAFLEGELSRRDRESIGAHSSQRTSPCPTRKSQDDDNLGAQTFITELESQLQTTRSALLSSKLELSDSQVENSGLRTQVLTQNNQIEHLLQENEQLQREIEGLQSQVETLYADRTDLTEIVRSHQRPHITTEENHSNRNSHFKKQDLQRHIDLLNRQVHETSKRQESLEIVESDLLSRLDKKEFENYELKRHLTEMRTQLDIKTDAINKAQQIIEQFTEKGEMDESQIQDLSQEIDQVRGDIARKKRELLETQGQLHALNARQAKKDAKLNEHLNAELRELKEALKSYQEELQSEKHNYHCAIEESQMEKDRLHVILAQMQNEHNAQLEEKDKLILDLEDLSDGLKQRMQESEAELSHKLSLQEQTSTNQINYMQKRLRDVMEEAHHTSTSQNSTKNAAPQFGFSYYSALKKEFEQVGSEIIEVREVIRAEGKKGGSFIGQKVSKFDEFRLNVLDELLLWDEKTAELARLANHYSDALDEQKQLFLQLKIVVQEKDKMIDCLQQQVVTQELTLQSQFDSMKAELDSSHKVLRDELMTTIHLMDQALFKKDQDLRTMDERLTAFREEFSQVLEERDFLDQQLDRYREKCGLNEKAYDRLRLQKQTHADKLFAFLNGVVLPTKTVSSPSKMINSGFADTTAQNSSGMLYMNQSGDNKYSQIHSDNNIDYQQNPQETRIENQVKALVEENYRCLQEVTKTGDLMRTLEKQCDEEKAFLKNKLKSVEEQLHFSQKSSIRREEEMQLEYLSKEEVLTVELNEAQNLAEKSLSEAQTRQRQLQKVQAKLDEEQVQVLKLQEMINKTAAEVRLAEEARDEAVKRQKDLERESNETKAMFNEKDKAINMYRDQQMDERTQRKQLENQLSEVKYKASEGEENLKKARADKDFVTNEMKDLEQKHTQLQKDLQALYKELGEAQQERERSLTDSRKAVEGSERLRHELNLAKKQVQSEQDEIQNYQRTVLQLTRELESKKPQRNQIADLQQAITQREQKIEDLNQYIRKLEKKNNPLRQNAMIQTSESGLIEVPYLRNEIIKTQRNLENVVVESNQLREALQRSSVEVCRLIEDKRELEDLIEKLNSNITFNRNHSQTQLARSPEAALGADSHVMSQILQEKENYINKLENEITGMRKDIDTTRENGLISHDLYSEGTAGVTLMSNGQQYFYQPHQAENVNYLLDLYPRHPGRLEPTHIDLTSFNKENVHDGNLYTLNSVSQPNQALNPASGSVPSKGNFYQPLNFYSANTATDDFSYSATNVNVSPYLSKYNI